MIDSLVYMAFVTGLLGTGHCIGMCGGLVSALSLSDVGRQGGWVFHLLYNVGRILTYTFIGAVVGKLGSALAYSDHFRDLSRLLLIGSDVFIILIGLGTAGIFAQLNITKLEFSVPSQLMSKVSNKLRKLPSAISGFPLGLIFGFIPCGYLYAVAITAAQSASVITAASMLFAFGLGTVPSLFFLGGATHWLSTKFRNWMLRMAGLVVAIMGCVNLINHLKLMGVFP